MTITDPGMFRYCGRSMWPCFQQGDLLEFERCTIAEIRIGDCIAYTSDDGTFVTHRVVAKGNALTTRGDAMPGIDQQAVSAERLTGRIVRRHRLGKVSLVKGGLTGRLAGRFYHFAGRIDPQRDAIGGKIARGLRTVSMTVMKRIWNRGREEKLTNGAGQEVVFWMIGGKAIGKRSSGRGGWQIAWPWNILVALRGDR